MKGVEAEFPCDKIDEDDYPQASSHLYGPGSPDEDHYPVDNKGHKEDVHHILPSHQWDIMVNSPDYQIYSSFRVIVF